MTTTPVFGSAPPFALRINAITTVPSFDPPNELTALHPKTHNLTPMLASREGANDRQAQCFTIVPWPNPPKCTIYTHVTSLFSSIKSTSSQLPTSSFSLTPQLYHGPLHHLHFLISDFIAVGEEGVDLVTIVQAQRILEMYISFGRGT